MLALRPLPPSFLLPAWSGYRLHQLRRFHASITNDAAATDDGEPSHPAGHEKATSSSELPISARLPSQDLKPKPPGDTQKLRRQSVGDNFRRFQPSFLSNTHPTKSPTQFVSFDEPHPSSHNGARLASTAPVKGHTLSKQHSAGSRVTTRQPPIRKIDRDYDELLQKHGSGGRRIFRPVTRAVGGSTIDPVNTLRSEEINKTEDVENTIQPIQPRKRRSRERDDVVNMVEQAEELRTQEAFLFQSLKQIRAQMRKLEQQNSSNVVPTGEEQNTLDIAPTTTFTESRQGEIASSKLPEKLSLLEELFPLEARRQKQEHLPSRTEEALSPAPDVPRLDPPAIQNLLDDFSKLPQIESKDLSQSRGNKEENLTVMAVSGLSTGLADADFRRVIPRGEHIEEWRGPGDVLKVIPVRDAVTMEPKTSYLLIFANPAYARVYKTHLETLHAMSRAHTPTSLESPLFSNYGRLIKGQNVHQLAQDYTLSPPSQSLIIRIIKPPYEYSIRNILAAKGYEQITQPENKAGRSVLFWVDGHVPSSSTVGYMLQKDSADRGVRWGPVDGKGSIRSLGRRDEYEGGGREGSREVERPEMERNDIYPRFVISFEDETEARRFARVWHQKPWPFHLVNESPPWGEPLPLIQATFLW